MSKVLIIILGFVACVVRVAWYESKHQSKIPAAWFETKQDMMGMVTQDPDRGLEKTKVVIGEWGVLVTLPSGVEVRYGDVIMVSGLIKHPEPFETDTGRQFNYPRYLAVQNIYGTMKAGDVRIVARHQGNRTTELLFELKHFFVHTVKKLFPLREAGLFAGIIMGEKSLLPKETLDDFQVAGLTHMIVLSGHNITLVTIGVGVLFGFIGLGYRARRVAALAVIPLFLLMTGMGSSSVRAGVMAMIMLVLQIMTRPAHTFRIIVYTVAILGWMNPRMILYDPSFHLSMLAFVGLVYVVPVAAAIAQRLPRLLGLTDLVIETTAVQLFVLPYILWMSGQISLLTLVSNLLAVPLNSFIMGAGFIATLCGMIMYPIGQVIALPVSWALSYIIKVAHVVGSVHAAVFIIPPFGWVILAGSYIAMAGFIFWWHRKK